MRIQDPELAFSGGGGLLALNSSSQEAESTVGGSGTKVILTYIPKYFLSCVVEMFSDFHVCF